MTDLPYSDVQGARRVPDGFLRSAAAYPERTALEVAGHVVTYRELRERATAVAALLTAQTPDHGPDLTAVFAHRSLTAFVGVLGALLRGHGYVPLNPKLPADRTRSMLEASGCQAVVVDEHAAVQLDSVLAGVERPLLLVLPDREDVTVERRQWPQHTVVGARDLQPVESWQRPEVDEHAIAYLLFTSGSTGVPKGVMVSHANVVYFVDQMVERIGVTHEDRFSQMFDMTFDISVFDLFVGWERGSCVCCPPPETLVKPGKFIGESELTIWFSVPSVALMMKRFGMLKAGMYPKLRWSLFAGEALPIEVARLWADAAPSSVVDNMYGPTEATVVCTGYWWDAERSPSECEQGIVPIGYPLPGMEAIVVDEDLREVAVGAEGELLMRGPLVTLGYLHDPERTALSYVVLPDGDAINYRTGDLVRRPAAGSPITYLGRIDHQVKINGFRVELGEIEARLREATGVEEVVALGWPKSESSALAVTAFIGDEGADADAARAQLAEHLPDYMVPRRIHLLPELPLNANGKFDRDALLRILEDGA